MPWASASRCAASGLAKNLSDRERQRKELDETLPIRRDETAPQLEGQLQAWLVGGQETGHQGERADQFRPLCRQNGRYGGAERMAREVDVRCRATLKKSAPSATRTRSNTPPEMSIDLSTD